MGLICMIVGEIDSAKLLLTVYTVAAMKHLLCSQRWSSFTEIAGYLEQAGLYKVFLSA